jgi:hypothetical protein
MEYLFVLFVILFSIYSAVLWRLRGGAFATFLDLNLGTQGTRLLTSFLLGFVFLFLNIHYGITIMVTIMIGLLISGWPPFQAMGQPYPGTPESSWLRWLPTRLGLTIDTVLYDIVGLFEAGLVFIAPTYAALTLQGFNASLLLFMPLVFPLAYYIPTKINLPTITDFVQGQVWGEVFVGFFLGLFLILCS